MENYRCPICNNCRLLRTIPRKIGGQVAECAICGHIALWPQPDEHAVLLQYAESAYFVKRDIGTAIFDNQAFNLMKRYDPRKHLTVLDVGCGLGAFLRKCILEKYRAVGIEVNKNIVDELVREGLEVYHKSLSEFKNTTKRFDWVACINVLEHLREPLSAIETLADLVKPHGLLLIQTPNGDAIEAFGEKAYGLHVDKEHLNYFRPNQLIRLFEHQGLRLVYKNYCPASWGTGRAKIFAEKSNNFALYISARQHVYQKNIKPLGIRAYVEKLPPVFRGTVRSIAQITRRICAMDEILSGKAHELILIMRRP